MNRYTALAAGLLATVAATPLVAQDSGWDMRATAYVWFPDTVARLSTPHGRVKAELPIKDALKHLDMGLMLAGVAEKGPWTMIGDLVYLNLGGGKQAPLGPLFSDAKARSRLGLLSGYALREVYADEHQSLDLGAGLRVVRSELRLTLHPGILPQQHFRANETWVDPLVAMRYELKLSPDWDISLAADYGAAGGSSSKETWQAALIASYRINDSWSAMAGYRKLRIDQKAEGLPYRLEMAGPVIGVQYRF